MPFEPTKRARRVAGKRAYPLSKVYGLLEPGPVVLVTTEREGKPDVMPMSWHLMMEFEPPLVGCVISDRKKFVHLHSTHKKGRSYVIVRSLQRQDSGQHRSSELWAGQS